MLDILIKDTTIIKDGKGQSYKTIAIKDGKINHIYDSNDPQIDMLSAKEVIDGRNHVTAPGMVNCHTHVAMGLLRNYADDLELMEWLNKAIWPAEEKLEADHVYWGTQLGIAEMIRSGTTCFSDMYFFMDTTAKVVAETGIRAVLARGLAGVSPSANQALEESKTLFKEWHGYDNHRIKVMLGPHAPYTCPDEYLKKVIALRDTLGAQIHMHISETKTEFNGVVARTGKTPVAHLNDLGIFDKGCLAAHCVHLTDEDIEILAEKKVRVAHNPQSNLKLASGIAPLPKLVEKGITVGLGTDGSASNNNADMLEEIRLAAMLHKATTYDPKMIPAAFALELGTLSGAKALDYHDLGAIEEGYQADLVLYNTQKVHWYPRYNDVAALVYAANSSDAETVIVQGKLLMRKGELLTIDEERLYKEIERISTIYRMPS